MRAFLLLPLIFLSLMTLAQAQKNFIDENYIEVQGKAEEEYTPDIVYLSIIIDERDFKDRKSLEKKELQLVQTLEKYNIDPIENLLINNLRSDFHRYLFRGSKVLKSRSYELKINDVTILSDLIIDLEKKDIARINISRTEYSEIEQAKIDLRVKAMKHSKAIADQMASAIDQTVGKAIHIMDQYQYMDNYRYRYAESAMMAGADMRAKQEIETTPLNIRPIKIETKVSVKYQLN